MIYDEYINLENYDIVPFVNPKEADRKVCLLAFPIRNLERGIFYLWISLEKEGYFLYMCAVGKTGFGLEIECGGDYGVKKMLLAPKNGRGVQRDYYNAAIKASIHAKRVAKELYPLAEIDWTQVEARPKRMTAMVFRGREQALAEEVPFVEVEYAFL